MHTNHGISKDNEKKGNDDFSSTGAQFVQSSYALEQLFMAGQPAEIGILRMAPKSRVLLYHWFHVLAFDLCYNEPCFVC